MEIKGKIKKISETVQISERFRKREFIVEYASNPDYPQPLQFEMVQDRCELLDPFEVDQDVEVFFDLRGREWTNPQGEVKYFNSLQACKQVSDQNQNVINLLADKVQLQENQKHLRDNLIKISCDTNYEGQIDGILTMIRKFSKE